MNQTTKQEIMDTLKTGDFGDFGVTVNSIAWAWRVHHPAVTAIFKKAEKLGIIRKNYKSIVGNWVWTNRPVELSA